MTDLLSSLGRKLARARAQMGLTQEQAASAIGVSREELSYYENGRREISLAKLARLADLYGYGIDHFLSASGPALDRDIAVAFRAETVSEDDLEIIAWAKKLVIDAHMLDRLLMEGRS